MAPKPQSGWIRWLRRCSDTSLAAVLALLFFGNLFLIVLTILGAIELARYLFG